MQLLYWITTSLVSAMLALSSYTYMFHQNTIIGVKELGIPDFLRWELAILKILALLVLLIPVFPMQVKEWAYAGVGLFFVTAIVAHIAHKDAIFITLINLVFIILLIVSRLIITKLIELK